jgi:DegV family protein with EDD domain
MVAEHEIPVIPLSVHWEGETYLDGVTLDSETFYRWLRERDSFPTTSQPSPGAFIEFFKTVAEERQTDTLLGIFISSDMSGTLASAVQAKAQLPDLNIELVDSRSVSMGLGLQVVTAAKAARQGTALDELLALTHRVRARMEVIFAVDTLEYLHRGGRIGGAARLLGTALNLKPVLTIEDGQVMPLEKVRRRSKSLQRIVEIAEKRLAGRRPQALGVMQAEADKDAQKLVRWVQERMQPHHLYQSVLTPVVGTHGGPGTVGLAFYAEA